VFTERNSDGKVAIMGGFFIEFYFLKIEIEIARYQSDLAAFL